MPILVAIYFVARWGVPAFWHVGLSPDGTLLVTTSGTIGGQPSDLRVWDAEMRQELFHFRHPTGVLVATFSPNGKTLAAGHWDGTISLREVATWQETRVLKAHESVVRSLAFSPDGEKLVTSCVDGTVKLWDVATGSVESEVSHGGYVNEIALSPDGKTLATAGQMPVRLWSITDGKIEPLLASPAYSTEPVAFRPDGKLIAVAGTIAGTISLWDPASGQVSMSVVDLGARSAAFSPDGILLVIVGNDNPIKVWNLATGPGFIPGFIPLTGHRKTVWSAAFSPDGKTVATASQDGTARLWDVASGRQKNLRSNQGWLPWSIGGLIAAFIAWSVAWVQAGMGDPNPRRPLWDLLLLNAIVFGGLMLRSTCSGFLWEVERPATLFMLALLGSWMSLIVFWAAAGSRRWSLRLPGFFVGVAIVASVPLVFSKVDSWFTWQLVIGGGCMIASMLILLKLMRSWGLRLVRIGATDAPSGASSPDPRPQYPLQDLVLWTIAAAVFFAVARFAKPVGMWLQLYMFLAASGVSISLVAVAACWTTLGSRRAALRLLVLALAIALYPLHHMLLFSSVPLLDPSWDLGLPLLLAAYIIASLWIYRIHGYRLGGGNHLASDAA